MTDMQAEELISIQRRIANHVVAIFILLSIIGGAVVGGFFGWIASGWK